MDGHSEEGENGESTSGPWLTGLSEELGCPTQLSTLFAFLVAWTLPVPSLANNEVIQWSPVPAG